MRFEPGSAGRCRPYLGTLVRVRASARDDAAALAAVEAAFSEIALVHRLMSFHDPESDVGLLNRRARKGPVRVDEKTWEVLEAAETIYRETGGLFDVTAAERLVAWGLLPNGGRRLDPEARGGDVELGRAKTVRFRTELAVDLGGIAKGYAVDRAVGALRRCGAQSGSVEAGGDLYVFGPAAERVDVRLPQRRGVAVRALEVSNGAAATSGGGPCRRRRGLLAAAAVVHGRTRKPLGDTVSATVAAPTALLADALAKAALASPSEMVPVLSRFSACALLVSSDGSVERVS